MSKNSASDTAKILSWAPEAIQDLFLNYEDLKTYESLPSAKERFDYIAPLVIANYTTKASIAFKEGDTQAGMALMNELEQQLPKFQELCSKK